METVGASHDSTCWPPLEYVTLQYTCLQSRAISLLLPTVHTSMHTRDHVSAKATSGKSTGRHWAHPCTVPQHTLPTRLLHGHLGAAGRVTRLGQACARCASAAYGGCRRRAPKGGSRDAADAGGGAPPAMGGRKHAALARGSPQAVAGHEQRADGSVRVMMRCEERRRKEGSSGGRTS